jgi:hypothetical protein
MAPIIVPAIDDDAPDELKRRAAKLAEQVTKRDARLADHDLSLQSLRDAPLETAGVMKGAHKWKETAFDELAVELRLRREVQELAAAHREALAKLRTEADAAFERTKADILQTLVGLGWHLQVSGCPDPGAILPIFYLSHPSVRAARNRADELQRKAQDRSLERSNAEAIQHIESKLTAGRERLAAV